VESTMTHCTNLKALHSRARRLTSSALSLVTIFAEKADRLGYWDEASRLKASYSLITQQLERVQRSEDAASYGHSQANLAVSLGGLAIGGLIKMASRNERLSAFADSLLDGLGNKGRPFGLVLICIGPKGLPDGAEVVSISRLARESNRDEFEVIKKLREGGYLLLSEKAFSLLIDRLIEDVREGRLCLPVYRGKLSEIMSSNKLKLRAKKVEKVE
jgi:hypothetical protein